MSPWLSDALLRSQSDERLIALAREGRERAFSTLVERYRRPLLGFARQLGAGGRAEDVVQQALMQAWTALQNGADVGHARGWLHQIVRHAAWKSAARAGGGDQLPGDLVGSEGPQGEVEARLRMRDVVTEVNKLPDRQRAALVQTELEGRTRQEIALGLGLSESAVRQLVHRARTSVRAACTAVTPGPVVAWAARRTPSAGMSEQVASTVAAGGTAGGVGLFAKVGGLVAAGALATSVAVPADHSAPAHRSDARAAARADQTGASTAGRSDHGAGAAGDARGNHGGRGRGAAAGHGRIAGARGAHSRASGGAARGRPHRGGGGAAPSSGQGGPGGGGGEHHGDGGLVATRDGSGSGPGGGSSHSGPGPSGSGSSGSGTSGRDSGSSGSGSSGSGSSGSGSGSSGSSGPGSGDRLSGGGTGISGSGDSGSGSRDGVSGSSGPH